MAVFYNQAILSYAGGAVRSNRVSAEIAETITLTKTPVSGGYAAGGMVVYAVGISNAGDAAANGLTLTDDLGGYTYGGETVYPLSYREGSLLAFLDGAPAAAPTAAAGPPLTVSGISVPAGGSMLLLYEASVTAYAPLGEGAQITNTAALTGDAVAAEITASAEIPAQAATQLSITKTASPDPLAAGDAVTYTFVIQNFGEETAVVVSDPFDPVLSGVSATLNGTAFTAFSYDPATGLFATNAGAVTVPAATFSQETDGTWAAAPGIAVLAVTGTI